MNAISPTRLTTIAIALIATVCLLGLAVREPASAADSETAQLISCMNGYRGQQSVGALTATGALNSEAQSVAQEVADSGSYAAMYNTGHTTFGAYGFQTAEEIWAAWEDDPIYLPYIANAKYHTVGVGRAFGQHFQPMWVVMLDKAGSASSPSTSSCASGQTTAPTPTPTPTPTATPDGSQTPTSTPTPTPTPVSPTLTPEPTATPFVQLQGDVDCDGNVSLTDVLEIIKLIGGTDADTDCLGESGIDCTGGVDQDDALALMRFLGGIPFEFPDGCPDIGSAVATPTPEPTETPEPGGVVNQCWVAMIAYDMTYAWDLNGEHSCEPENGPAYMCDFPEASNQTSCSTLEEGFSGYDCYVWATLSVPCVATGDPGPADYLCDRDEGAINCHSEAMPAWECVVSADVVGCTGPASFTWSPTFS